MKCNECGFENKDTAKFCSKCGCSLEVVKPPVQPASNNNSKIIIAALIIIIVILAVFVGYFALNNNANVSQSPVQSNSNASNNNTQSSQQNTTSVQSTTQEESKEWELIGTYSGSGSGSQSISVPAGQIMVKISAYPIKNYATNHLYVTGSNGQSAGVDWGSHSDVETRSDSVTYTSSSPQTFNIDYYETVSWQVEFYRYQ